MVWVPFTTWKARKADFLPQSSHGTLLLGSDGRDILIGGLDQDRLVGGGDDDLLIGGSTSADEDDDLLMDALAAWNSTG